MFEVYLLFLTHWQKKSYSFFCCSLFLKTNLFPIKCLFEFDLGVPLSILRFVARPMFDVRTRTIFLLLCLLLLFICVSVFVICVFIVYLCFCVCCLFVFVVYLCFFVCYIRVCCIFVFLCLLYACLLFICVSLFLMCVFVVYLCFFVCYMRVCCLFVFLCLCERICCLSVFLCLLLVCKFISQFVIVFCVFVWGRFVDIFSLPILHFQNSKVSFFFHWRCCTFKTVKPRPRL